MSKVFKRFNWRKAPPRKLSCGAFLDVHEYQVRHEFTDGSHGSFYKVEAACPPCLDAVVLVIFTPGPPAQILLRKGMRPAAALRTIIQLPKGSNTSFPDIYWELPAGGVEADDWLKDGALAFRAKKEGWEETGLHLQASNFFTLGPSPFPTSAFSPERLHFMAIKLPEATPLLHAPPGDGHPMEEGSSVEWVDITTAYQWCRHGQIIDSKTELGIRRLIDFLADK